MGSSGPAPLHDVVQLDIGRDLVLLPIPSASLRDVSITDAAGGQRESPMNLSCCLTEPNCRASKSKAIDVFG